MYRHFLLAAVVADSSSKGTSTRPPSPAAKGCRRHGDKWINAEAHRQPLLPSQAPSGRKNPSARGEWASCGWLLKIFLDGRVLFLEQSTMSGQCQKSQGAGCPGEMRRRDINSFNFRLRRAQDPGEDRPARVVVRLRNHTAWSLPDQRGCFGWQGRAFRRP